jgi:hypothetical protein
LRVQASGRGEVYGKGNRSPEAIVGKTAHFLQSDQIGSAVLSSNQEYNANNAAEKLKEQVTYINSGV